VYPLISRLQTTNISLIIPDSVSNFNDNLNMLPYLENMSPQSTAKAVQHLSSKHQHLENKQLQVRYTVLYLLCV